MSSKKVLKHQDIIKDYQKAYQLRPVLAIITGLVGEMLVIGVLSLSNPISFVVFPASTVLIFVGVRKLNRFRSGLRKIEDKQYSICLSDGTDNQGTPKMIVVKIHDKSEPVLRYNSELYDVDQGLNN